MKVLVVEDSPPTRDLLGRSLRDAGMDVVFAARIGTGLERATERTFDVIVLDLMLPDGDGLSLCRELRAMGIKTPILCLTARVDVADRVAGLDSGADDYLKKPFALAELHARIRALARRRGAPAPAVLESASSRIDLGARRLLRDGDPVPLTDREWKVLELLASRQDQMVERGEILEAVWHEGGPSAAESLEVILSRLRRKLGGPDGAFVIRTIRGAGVVFERKA
jgi:two-component system, OmpR family, response regulator